MVRPVSQAPRAVRSQPRALGALLLHALVIWAACAATMGIGQAVTSMKATLVIHAVAAPIFAATVSAFYFRRYEDASPLYTAWVVLTVIVLVDFLLVAVVVLRSLEMFRSLLGTWLPFLLIFVATTATGWAVRATRQRKTP